MAIIFVPQILKNFSERIEEKPLRIFTITLNIILVVTSSHGLQSGYSALYSNSNPSTKNTASIILFDSDPWLEPAIMKQRIVILIEKNRGLSESLNASSARADSLGIQIDKLNSKLTELYHIIEIQEYDTKETVNLLSKVKNEKRNEVLLIEKDLMIDSLINSYDELQIKYKNQLELNIAKDSLLHIINTTTSERLNRSAYEELLRRIDSLDRFNEH